MRQAELEYSAKFRCPEAHARYAAHVAWSDEELEAARREMRDLFSTRVSNCLGRAGVVSLWALSKLSDADLLEIRAMGEIGLLEIRTKLPPCDVVANWVGEAGA